MEPTPTADLDRNNDRVYDSTICVVRAITELTHGVQGSGKPDYLDLVRRVGLELRVLLGSVDDLVAFFPDVAKHEVGRRKRKNPYFPLGKSDLCCVQIDIILLWFS